MCFSPVISLSTAIVEFVVATLILIFFRKSLVNKFFIIFIYLLGFYQFSEFMLCTFNNPILWIKLGYVTYTFLPTIGLHFVIRLTNIKYKGSYSLLYILPTIFVLIAIFTKNFVIGSECSAVFVMVKLAKNQFHSALYTIYYFGFIALVGLFLCSKLRKEKSHIRRKLYITILFAGIVSLVSALVLIVILPPLNVMFPSVYCEFAFAFTIAALIGAYLDSRVKQKK